MVRILYQLKNWLNLWSQDDISHELSVKKNICQKSKPEKQICQEIVSV